MTIPFWTAKGTIDLADLRPEDMTAEVLADTMAKTNRFGGRTREPWSIACHSVLVERLCPPEIGPWALLHDAHECFLGDIATPMVDLIAVFGGIPDFDSALAMVKARLDRLVASAWNTPVRSVNRELRDADRIALCAEEIVLIGDPDAAFDPKDIDEIDRAISILMEMPIGGDWRGARDLWLSRVEHYAAHGGLTPPVAS